MISDIISSRLSGLTALGIRCWPSAAFRRAVQRDNRSQKAIPLGDEPGNDVFGLHEARIALKGVFSTNHRSQEGRW
jgi:hypothetical protein